MAGIELVGRDRFGVFPLRGKLLNVRDASNTSLKENVEIQHLIKIIGLQLGTEYKDVKSLRYGGLMIMADQDPDGSHIKGLVINFFQAFWPSLFQIDGFLMQFITPIIKASKKMKSILSLRFLITKTGQVKDKYLVIKSNITKVWVQAQRRKQRNILEILTLIEDFSIYR